MPETVVESPPMRAASLDEFRKHADDLISFVERTGGCVRVMDRRDPDRVFWLSASPPPFVGTLLEDDTPQVQRAQRRTSRAARRQRRARQRAASWDMAEARRHMQINMDGVHHD